MVLVLACASPRAWGFEALPLDTVDGVPETRQRFHEDLAELERQALDGIELVIQQLDRALESLMY